MLVKKLLTRRAHRLLGGLYKWQDIIKEPCGWLVIKDKIAMI